MVEQRDNEEGVTKEKKGGWSWVTRNSRSRRQIQPVGCVDGDINFTFFAQAYGSGDQDSLIEL